jgi:integrase
MAKSTTKSGQAKTRKPRSDFPLFPHANGQWAKKIRGRLRYFGRVTEDPDGKTALENWLTQKDDLLAGREPMAKREGLTVGDACDEFLHAKRQKVESGELADSTWQSYQQTGKQVVRVLGRDRLVEDLRGADFDRLRSHFASKNKLVGLRNRINHTRIIFKYAYDAELIEQPVRFGANFRRPSAKNIRKHRVSRMFEAEELRVMLKNAGPTLKAMILLGVNCGFGGGDVATLPRAAVDLTTGWVTYPRPKTGAVRRVPLWPETVAAIEAAVASQSKPIGDHRHLLFVTEKGEPYEKGRSRYIAHWFRNFQEALKMYQPGRGFYTLRHVFETIGGESRDQVAVDSIMGHERGGFDMGAHYRERISDDRLLAVVNTVRDWLYAEPAGDDDGVGQDHIIPFRTVG